jgi:hypothetical protein
MALVVLLAVVAAQSKGYLARRMHFLCGHVISGSADIGRDLRFRLVTSHAIWQPFHFC